MDINKVIRRAIRVQAWRPGVEGKGIVTPTGTVLFWQDKVYYDGGRRMWIDHYDAIEALGLKDRDLVHAYIDKYGRVDAYGDVADKHRNRINAKVNQLIDESFS